MTLVTKFENVLDKAVKISFSTDRIIVVVARSKETGSIEIFKKWISFS